MARVPDRRGYLPGSARRLGLRPVVEGYVNPATDEQWSPDGSRIAYLREGALFIVNVDGGHDRIVEGIRARGIAWDPAV
jgi:hypothetical protein